MSTYFADIPALQGKAGVDGQETNPVYISPDLTHRNVGPLKSVHQQHEQLRLSFASTFSQHQRPRLEPAWHLGTNLIYGSVLPVLWRWRTYTAQHLTGCHVVVTNGDDIGRFSMRIATAANEDYSYEAQSYFSTVRTLAPPRNNYVIRIAIQQPPVSALIARVGKFPAIDLPILDDAVGCRIRLATSPTSDEYCGHLNFDRSFNSTHALFIRGRTTEATRIER